MFSERNPTTIYSAVINNSNILPTGDTLCANYLLFRGGILLLYNAVCLSYMFIKFETTFWIWHRITGTNLYSLWQLFKICGGKKISVWVSKTFTESYWQITKYVKVTISACRRLSELWWNTCGKLKNKKVAAQMCLGQEAVWRLRLNKSIVTSTM